ncbi:MAG: ankyrin repeat domain-containing protein, partial [Candidatus Thiodiazotropha taylori]|nr:ankyrin repeat domain-containing protein [Candidatus Thiodiazotropha taylori]MCW4290425.1 ankyrin repeat domain-containing protein [Candidatus Thiodiazotropha taylori]
VKLLLEAGADVNLADSDGVTPLMEAARTGSGEIVTLLLQHNADKTNKDNEGHTAADIAVKKKHNKVSGLLK